MYLEHFSLNERPFSISPDPRFLFMSNRYREALAHLTYGVEDGGGFVLLTGEVGTGKTTVCRCLLQQLPDKTRLAFVLNPKLNSLELLATICDELGIDYPENCQSLKILTDRLSDYLVQCFDQGLSVVVMIDEAQNIDTEVLEQIRLLTNLETNQKKLLQIILVGQPELQEKLARRDLRQLAQRITARYHLRPLNLKETIAYVLHRIRIAGTKKPLFSRSAVELLHQKTNGIPRLINTICDRALVAAASRNKLAVDQKLMREAIADVIGAPDFKSPVRQPNQWRKKCSYGDAFIVSAGFCILARTTIGRK
ncbi:MAG: AAA family ATPase [Enterobacterales bacterium]|nr:AAA family ATPase [Enterobacterales bacterium]